MFHISKNEQYQIHLSLLSLCFQEQPFQGSCYQFTYELGINAKIQEQTSVFMFER